MGIVIGLMVLFIVSFVMNGFENNFKINMFGLIFYIEVLVEDNLKEIML